MSPNESNKTSISRDIKSGFPIKTIKWLEFSNFIHVFCMTLKFSKISIFDKSMYTWSWRKFDKLILVKLYVIYIYIYILDVICLHVVVQLYNGHDLER